MNHSVFLDLVVVREAVTPTENSLQVELLLEGVHTSCSDMLRLLQQLRHLLRGLFLGGVLLLLLNLLGILSFRATVRQPELGQYEVFLRGGQGLQVGVVGGGAVMV